MTDATTLAERILKAKRPGGWEDVDRFRFYVEAASQMDYARFRASAATVRVENGEQVPSLDTHALAEGWLGMVTDWDGVTAGDFPGVTGVTDEQRTQAIPFSPALLRAFLANRLALATQLIGRAKARHEDYAYSEAADRKN